MKRYYVYFMSNESNTVSYLGVSNDVNRRAQEHRNHLNKGSFTDRYNCCKLVYFEEYCNVEEAIRREKQLKNWQREWKNVLINRVNPDWRDLFDE